MLELGYCTPLDVSLDMLANYAVNATVFASRRLQERKRRASRAARYRGR